MKVHLPYYIFGSSHHNWYGFNHAYIYYVNWVLQPTTYLGCVSYMYLVFCLECSTDVYIVSCWCCYSIQLWVFITTHGWQLVQVVSPIRQITTDFAVQLIKSYELCSIVFTMYSYFSLSVINSCACIDPADQCQNGGTCNDNSPVGSGITCTCPCGFTGKAGSLYRIFKY